MTAIPLIEFFPSGYFSKGAIAHELVYINEDGNYNPEPFTTKPLDDILTEAERTQAKMDKPERRFGTYRPSPRTYLGKGTRRNGTIPGII